MIAVILCGGSGTRLWPISRKSYPKQFLKLYGKNSLLQDTYLRTSNVVENNKIIDEVLVSYFKAPKSYTTENMCEINAHGGNIVVKKILELCLANGAEMAGPGEFTKRAFLNGRIDLAQAESVIDVINAKSEREAKSGIKQLEGFLSTEINQIKQDILVAKSMTIYINL